jgi:hypothetical protein
MELHWINSCPAPIEMVLENVLSQNNRFLSRPGANVLLTILGETAFFFLKTIVMIHFFKNWEYVGIYLNKKQIFIMMYMLCASVPCYRWNQKCLFKLYTRRKSPFRCHLNFSEFAWGLFAEKKWNICQTWSMNEVNFGGVSWKNL